jgi:hypothetical protein
MSEQAPEPPDDEPATPFEPLDLETPQVDTVDRGNKHDNLETRDLPHDD